MTTSCLPGPNCDLAKGDLLIEGKKIVDIKPEIGATAEILDASGTIMIPARPKVRVFIASHATGSLLAPAISWTL